MVFQGSMAGRNAESHQQAKKINCFQNEDDDMEPTGRTSSQVFQEWKQGNKAGGK